MALQKSLSTAARAVTDSLSKDIVKQMKSALSDKALSIQRAAAEVRLAKLTINWCISNERYHRFLSSCTLRMTAIGRQQMLNPSLPYVQRAWKVRISSHNIPSRDWQATSLRRRRYRKRLRHKTHPRKAGTRKTRTETIRTIHRFHNRRLERRQRFYLQKTCYFNSRRNSTRRLPLVKSALVLSTSTPHFLQHWDQLLWKLTIPSSSGI